jgi:electron transfer flavoprotein beta subunit
VKCPIRLRKKGFSSPPRHTTEHQVKQVVRSIVCIKYAIDVNQLRLDPASKAPAIKGAARRISDIDKNAIEEAVRIKEKHGGEVLVLTVGPPEARDALREALAMGADQAYLITDPSFENLDTGGVSAVLAAAVSKLGGFDIVLTGEATVDSFSSQVGPRLAEHLSVPQVTYVRRIAFENGKITAERDLEDSHEVVETDTPALVTVTKEVNNPRFPSLMAILAASKKEIKTLSATDLPIQKAMLEPSIMILDVVAPEMRRKGVIIRDKPVAEMADELAQTILKERVGG